MSNSQQAIDKLDDSVRKLDKLAEILFYVTTIDERRSTLNDTLKQIRNLILTVNDGLLYSLSESLQKGHETFVPRYEQILQTDYNAFLKRLSELWSEAAITANEASIELKESIGLKATTGIWGPKGWKPIANE